MVKRSPVALVATDGVALAGTWFVGRDADAVVLVAGATAVPHRFYARWAEDLADRRFEVLTFDYRGIGDSERAAAATMQDWGRRDLAAAYAEAERVAAGRPVLLVGHSFGGQALGLLEGGERLAGGVLVAAGWGWHGYQPAWKRPALWVWWNAVIPFWLAALGRVPAGAGLGDGLPGGVAEEWARWCRSPDYLLAHVPDARARFGRVRGRFDVLSISDDGYIPHPAVAQLARVLPGAELACLDASEIRGGVGHFGLFRPSAERWWDDVARRLRRHADRATRGERAA